MCSVPCLRCVSLFFLFCCLFFSALLVQAIFSLIPFVSSLVTCCVFFLHFSYCSYLLFLFVNCDCHSFHFLVWHFSYFWFWPSFCYFYSLLNIFLFYICFLPFFFLLYISQCLCCLWFSISVLVSDTFLLFSFLFYTHLWVFQPIHESMSALCFHVILA